MNKRENVLFETFENIPPIVVKTYPQQPEGCPELVIRRFSLFVSLQTSPTGHRDSPRSRMPGGAGYSSSSTRAVLTLYVLVRTHRERRRISSVEHTADTQRGHGTRLAPQSLVLFLFFFFFFFFS